MVGWGASVLHQRVQQVMHCLDERHITTNQYWQFPKPLPYTNNRTTATHNSQMDGSCRSKVRQEVGTHRNVLICIKIDAGVLALEQRISLLLTRLIGLAVCIRARPVNTSMSLQQT